MAHKGSVTTTDYYRISFSKRRRIFNRVVTGSAVPCTKMSGKLFMNTLWAVIQCSLTITPFVICRLINREAWYKSGQLNSSSRQGNLLPVRCPLMFTHDSNNTRKQK